MEQNAPERDAFHTRTMQRSPKVDEVSGFPHFFLNRFLYAWYFVHCIEKMLPFLWILDVSRSIAHAVSLWMFSIAI
jgi:hypothetical protein